MQKWNVIGFRCRIAKNWLKLTTLQNLFGWKKTPWQHMVFILHSIFVKRHYLKKWTSILTIDSFSGYAISWTYRNKTHSRDSIKLRSRFIYYQNLLISYSMIWLTTLVLIIIRNIYVYVETRTGFCLDVKKKMCSAKYINLKLCAIYQNAELKWVHKNVKILTMTSKPCSSRRWNSFYIFRYITFFLLLLSNVRRRGDIDSKFFLYFLLLQSNEKIDVQRDKHSPRIGNGFVWTVSVVEGNILCDAVGDIALELFRSVAVAMVK